MSNLLAIFDVGSDHHSDATTLQALAGHHPDRVCVLITGTEVGLADAGLEAGALRDRLAQLLTAIELETGATVSGLVGGRDDLHATFDTVVGDARVPVAA